MIIIVCMCVCVCVCVYVSFCFIPCFIHVFVEVSFQVVIFNSSAIKFLLFTITSKLFPFLKLISLLGIAWLCMVFICSAKLWKKKQQMSHVMRLRYFSSPQTHSSNALTPPSSGTRCPIFGRTLRLLPYFMCANSEGSGKTAQMLPEPLLVAYVISTIISWAGSNNSMWNAWKF